ncbi:MAG: T9SS type A sorting domain-containing protein [Rhodothermales bacterium]
MLGTFYYNDTNLCEQLDEAFQAWLRDIADLQNTGCTNVATEELAEIPAEFALEANYPNLFNPYTLIRYALPQRTAVRLSVYDLQGRLVWVFVGGERAAGWHEVRFEADGLPSGVYFYQMEAGVFRAVHSMMLLR